MAQGNKGLDEVLRMLADEQRDVASVIGSEQDSQRIALEERQLQLRKSRLIIGKLNEINESIKKMASIGASPEEIKKMAKRVIDTIIDVIKNKQRNDLVKVLKIKQTQARSLEGSTREQKIDFATELDLIAKESLKIGELLNDDGILENQTTMLSSLIKPIIESNQPKFEEGMANVRAALVLEEAAINEINAEEESITGLLHGHAKILEERLNAISEENRPIQKAA